jgi:hypothetical protein
MPTMTSEAEGMLRLGVTVAGLIGLCVKDQRYNGATALGSVDYLSFR